MLCLQGGSHIQNQTATSDGAAGSGYRKGKICTKNNPITSHRPMKTHKITSTLPYELHITFDLCSHFNEKRIKARNTSFGTEVGISSQ